MIDRRRNRRIAILTSGVILAMLGLTAASVPLYDLFCRVTGYGGTPRVTAETAPGAGSGSITVLFNADVGKGLPWRFQPAQRSQEADHAVLQHVVDIGDAAHVGKAANHPRRQFLQALPDGAHQLVLGLALAGAHPIETPLQDDRVESGFGHWVRFPRRMG